METGEIQITWFSQAKQGQEWYFTNNNEKPKAQHDLSNCYINTRETFNWKKSRKPRMGVWIIATIPVSQSCNCKCHPGFNRSNSSLGSACTRHRASPVSKGHQTMVLSTEAAHVTNVPRAPHTSNQKCHTADFFLPTFPQEHPPTPSSLSRRMKALTLSSWTAMNSWVSKLHTTGQVRICPCLTDQQPRGFWSEIYRVRTKTLQFKCNMWKTTLGTSLMTERKCEAATPDLN